MALFVSKRPKSDAREAVPPWIAAAACRLNPEGVTLPLPPAQAGGLRRTRAAPSPRMGATDNSPAFQRWVRTRPCRVKAPEGRQSPIRAAEASAAGRPIAIDGGGRDTLLCGSPGCRWVLCQRLCVGRSCDWSHAHPKPWAWHPASGVCRPSGAKEGVVRPRHPALKRWAIVCRPHSGAQDFSLNIFLRTFFSTQSGVEHDPCQ
jgi:hypothetical protein